MHYGADVESARFASEIVSLFKEAGWDPKSFIDLAGTPPKGVYFKVREDSEDIRPYYRALSVFLEFGKAEAVPAPNIPSGHIEIVVGTKD